jgi:hypothetical protein
MDPGGDPEMPTSPQSPSQTSPSAVAAAMDMDMGMGMDMDVTADEANGGDAAPLAAASPAGNRRSASPARSPSPSRQAAAAAVDSAAPAPAARSHSDNVSTQHASAFARLVASPQLAFPLASLAQTSGHLRHALARLYDVMHPSSDAAADTASADALRVQIQELNAELQLARTNYGASPSASASASASASSSFPGRGCLPRGHRPCRRPFPLPLVFLHFCANPQNNVEHRSHKMQAVNKQLERDLTEQKRKTSEAEEAVSSRGRVLK